MSGLYSTSTSTRKTTHLRLSTDGHIHEFPSIRIDSFSQSPTPGFPAAQLYLLTHAHTDHLTGLDSASTNIVIICSEVTKRLVLNYEREKDRVAFDRGNVERRRRAYVGLVAASEAARTGKRKRGEVVRDPFVSRIVRTGEYG
jgi:L-ascorbate metabolism protein UlaG (beta-lactamase superfamily)